jgi:hypothetical protein
MAIRAIWRISEVSAISDQQSVQTAMKDFHELKSAQGARIDPNWSIRSLPPFRAKICKD